MNNTIATTIHIDDYQYEYFVKGNSEKIIIAFNGFGKDAKELLFFANGLKEYRIIAVNLLFHGNSNAFLNTSSPISNEHFSKFIHTLLEKENIENFSLFGYSLGGKIALKILEIFPERINQIILLAPDGIKNNIWYNLATKNSFYNALFKHFTTSPFLLFLIVSFLSKMRLIPKSKEKFIHHQFDTPQKRKMVYNVWVAYSNILPNISKIKTIIKINQTNCLLIYGKFDSIIPASTSNIFIRGNEKYVHIEVIEHGHNLINEKSLTVISKYIR